MNKEGTPEKETKITILETMHKTSHLRDDIDRTYVSRKEEGSGPNSV